MTPPRAELSSEPPFGLVSIDMPDTEEDIVAVMEAFPDEIGGHARSGGGPTGVMYGLSEIPWMVTALPASDPVMQVGEDPDPTPAEYVAARVSQGSLGTIEASALDLSGDLVWAATNPVEPADVGTAYLMTWALPEGAWAFHIQADSAAGREQLVHMFITAVAGGDASAIDTIAMPNHQ